MSPFLGCALGGDCSSAPHTRSQLAEELEPWGELFGYSFGTAVALNGGHDDDRVAAIATLVPCDHGYFGAELADPESLLRDFLDAVTEALFGEGGPGPGGTGNRVDFSGFESWRLDADGLVADSLGTFDAEEYRRQLEVGVGEQ